MKKLFFVALVLLLVGAVSTSLSQVKFSFGPKLGLNMASASFDPDWGSNVTKSSRTGFIGGAAFEVMFSGIPLGIEADLFYAMEGVKLEATNEKLTEKLDVIQIPVLLKGKFPTGSPISPYVYFGPALGIVASANETYEVTGQGSQDTDVKDRTSGTDFQLVFGGGAEFKIESKVGLTFDVRYGLGLNDMTKNPTAESRKVKTRALSIMIGAMFGL